MKINYNSKYAQKHLSIRVPWHDNAWNGTICSNSKNNDACLALKNCAENRNDNLETELAGKRICDIKDEKKLPPCISESAMFMSDFDFTKDIRHPYAKGYNSYYKHLLPTPVTFTKYSASAIPFKWGMPEYADEIAQVYELDYTKNREPYTKTKDEKLKFTTNWVQDFKNQKAVFDCFFEHIKPNDSLSFFYAKEVPFIEENNRVLVGLGEISSITQAKAFNTSEATGFSSMPWEHMVSHSIRPDNKNGFLFPYHEAIEYQKEHQNFDPKSIAVIIPNEFRQEFSYATEHVSHDYALYIIRESIKKIELAKEIGIGKDWDLIIEWLSKKLLIVKELRGDYPGFGASLTAFGIERGHFLAQHIFNTIKKEDCPWDYLDKIFSNKEKLPKQLEDSITEETRQLWSYYITTQKERLGLLQLLSRFYLNLDQVNNIFNEEKRKKVYKDVSSLEILTNPYLLYEISINSTHPINYTTIDSGLMLANSNLLPTQTKMFNKLSKERVRALTVMQLEYQANNGHTLFPEEKLITNIADLPIEPECNLNADYFNIATSIFSDVITTQFTADNKKAYQLIRFDETAELINKLVTNRLNAKRHSLDENWVEYLSNIKFKDTEADKKAKIEKVSALAEMANARFSVLIGQAGSGKTTLLSALASIPKIKNGNVLCLAPTGKAKVRMEEQAKKYGVTAKTIASFLFKSKRFKGSTQTYQLNDEEKESGYKTVIIDECSMLTEEMLAATLQHLKRVERLILVGDYRQLPPIGAGRPFFDIINFIKPEGIETKFPKVENSYIELTASARQEEVGDEKRLDKEFAYLFGGNIKEQNSDEIFERVIARESENIKIYNWKNETDFEELLYEVLDKELNITGEASFNKSIGSTDGKFFNWKSAVNSIENWQLLSPVKSKIFGTNQLNRGIHKEFKKEALHWSYNAKKNTKPLGLDEIIYGDKVINIENHPRTKGTYPDDGINYIANGEIGITVGRSNWKNGKYGKQPYQLEVEFSSQKGYKYEYTSKDFDDEKGSLLELAYALTIHKAQGSQFNTVILAIPEPCVLLSRELIYTALTRQTDKVILLYQGNTQMLFNYTNDYHSASLQRITNLFYKPNISSLKDRFFEKNLIHCASDGKFLRSKSEVIIYELLLKNNLEPEYEHKLEIDGQIKRPDFFIVDDDSGVEYYWEHLGMLSDISYSKKWKEKLEWYKSKDILPFEQGGGVKGTLIITEDDAKGGISVKDIADKISKIFDIKPKLKIINEIEELTNVIFELRDSVEKQFFKLSIKFDEIKNASKESDSKIESIYELLDQESETNNFQKYFKTVQEEIEEYDLLDDNSKKFLASSYFLKEKFEKSKIEDYSPFILQFSRAIENELLNKIFISFYPKLDAILVNNPSFLDSESENKKTLVFAKSLNKRSDKFTLGTMVFILSCIYNLEGSTLNSSNLLKVFRNHTLSVIEQHILNKEFIESMQGLTSEYRNKAAHISQIGIFEAEEFFVKGKNIINDFMKSLKK